jgi:hypothetical protein
MNSLGGPPCYRDCDVWYVPNRVDFAESLLLIFLQYSVFLQQDNTSLDIFPRCLVPIFVVKKKVPYLAIMGM